MDQPEPLQFSANYLKSKESFQGNNITDFMKFFLENHFYWNSGNDLDDFENEFIQHLEGIEDCGTKISLKDHSSWSSIYRLEGCSLLVFAASYNLTGLAQFLLKKGADPNRAPGVYNTALYYACSHDNLELVETLFEYDADPNLPSNKNSYPIHFANDLRIVRLLIEKNAIINPETLEGMTALSIAVDFGNKEKIALLVANGAVPRDHHSGIDETFITSNDGQKRIPRLLLDAKFGRHIRKRQRKQ